MTRYFLKHRRKEPRWKGNLAVQAVALIVCLTILAVTTIEKFPVGGWLTLLITSLVIGLCYLTKAHYNKVRQGVREMDDLLTAIPVHGPRNDAPVDPAGRTAIQLVNGYNGFGIHTFLSINREFPGMYRNFVFVSVGEVDISSFKGAEAVSTLENSTQQALGRYVDLARRMGFAAEARHELGTDIVETASRLVETIARTFPKSTVFAGQSVFRQSGMIHRLLHNETAFAIQQELRWRGITTVILPIRINI